METIYTHSGMFHADDAMAVAIALSAGFGPSIKRVRQLPDDFDPSNGDIAVDVGGMYLPNSMKFDHHQKGGNDDGCAATGKLWHSLYWDLGNSPSREVARKIQDRVYETCLAAIDRADIGVADWTPVKDEWRHLSASSFIASMNPPFGSTEEVQMECFLVAVKACQVALKGAQAQAQAWVEMKELVESATQPIDEILVLERGGPWQEHVVGNHVFKDLLFVIFPSDRGGYQIQCVPPHTGSFAQKKPLPQFLAGLRGEELAKVLQEKTGKTFAPGSALFCHPGRFIGGAETLDETLEIAALAISD